MKRINKILSIVLLVVLMSVPLLSTVQAKPSEDKNNPKFMDFMWYTTNPLDNVGGTTPIDVMTNPPWADPEGSDVIVTHTYGEWILDPAGTHYVQIGTDQYTIDPETGYEGFLYVQTNALTDTLTGINYRVYEKIMWGDGNYIEIKANERATMDTSVFPPIFYASGTISGHGMVDGQNVQISGVREGYIDWSIATFVLENYGTIQFVGNAA